MIPRRGRPVRSWHLPPYALVSLPLGSPSGRSRRWSTLELDQGFLPAPRTAFLPLPGTAISMAAGRAGSPAGASRTAPVGFVTEMAFMGAAAMAPYTAPLHRAALPPSAPSIEPLGMPP